MPEKNFLPKPPFISVLFTKYTKPTLCVLITVLAGISVGAFAATRGLTLGIALILGILLALIAIFILTQDIKGKDLPIKKAILYLTIIAGFTGPAFLCIDIGPFSLFPY